MKIWSVAIAVVLFAAPAMADPSDGDVVGILHGKTYTYGELEPSSEEKSMAAKYAKGEAYEKALRAKAAVALRNIATSEILAKRNPDCDLVATPAETEAFLSWWQKSSQEILNVLVANTQAGSPDRKVRISGAWNDLDEINPGNSKTADAAREKIKTWKENFCVFKAYGGGRVHRDLGMYAFLEPGETPIGGYETLAGYPYPIVVSDGVPLNGYRALYEAAKESGAISFPDARYEEGFFAYYRNESLPSFAEADEEAAITTRYWEHPVPEPKP